MEKLYKWKERKRENVIFKKKNLAFDIFLLFIEDIFNHIGNRVYEEGALAHPALPCRTTGSLRFPIMSFLAGWQCLGKIRVEEKRELKVDRDQTLEALHLQRYAQEKKGGGKGEIDIHIRKQSSDSLFSSSGLYSVWGQHHCFTEQFVWSLLWEFAVSFRQLCKTVDGVNWLVQ